MTTYVKETRFPCGREALFAWHARPGAFVRLAPPWERIDLVEHRGGIRDGAILKMRLHKGPVSITWTAIHGDYIEGRQFRDIQKSGPFAKWEHSHLFRDAEPEGSILEDRIEYRLPLAPLSFLAGSSVHAEIDRLFTYRHRRTGLDLKRHESYTTERPRRIAITGSSGLVGTDLRAYLHGAGHETLRLVRRKPLRDSEEIFWSPEKGEIESENLEGLDAVIHLAGKGIADQRWTRRVKEEIRRSRVEGTELLCKTLAKLDRKPKVLVSASAAGFYGDRGPEHLTEESGSGSDFLADVCREWEAATESAREAGIRVVNLRIGVVLSGKGGALAKMLTPFKLGLGGAIGSGAQYMSWIMLDDLLGIVERALHDDRMSGPVNATSPNPVTNREFAKTLGRVLRRPTMFTVPQVGVRALFGEMGNALFAGQRAFPSKLDAWGFEFEHPNLEPALRFELGRE